MKDEFTEMEFNGVLAKFDLDTVIPNFHLDALMPQFDLDIVMPKFDLDTVMPKFDLDAAMPRFDLDAVIPKFDLDAVIPRFDLDAVIPKFDLDVVMPRFDLDAVISKFDLDVVMPRFDLDAVIPKFDLDVVMPRFDLDVVMPRFDLDVVMPKSDLDVVMRKFDLDAAIPKFDLAFPGINPDLAFPWLNLEGAPQKFNFPDVQLNVEMMSMRAYPRARLWAESELGRRATSYSPRRKSRDSHWVIYSRLLLMFKRAHGRTSGELARRIALLGGLSVRSDLFLKRARALVLRLRRVVLTSLRLPRLIWRARPKTGLRNNAADDSEDDLQAFNTPISSRGRRLILGARTF